MWKLLPFILIYIYDTYNTNTACENNVRQSDQKTQTWCEELVSLRYGPPLCAPISTVQTTMAAIDVPEFHMFIQESDIVVINEADDEGLHGPLMLNSLDTAA